MTLDEAIKHLEDTLADNSHEWSCAECKAEHEQLAEWLRDYKRLLEGTQQGEWIVTQEGRWLYPVCSLCGGKQDVKSNYCPDCGARMKGEEE